MTDVIYFVVTVLGLLVLAMLIFIGPPSKVKEFFSTADGKQARHGIVFFIGVGLLAVLIVLFSDKAKAEDAKYFSYAELYIGADSTFDVSPQCNPGENSDRITSNGGVRVSMVRFQRFSLNAKYTHHSCAFNTDRFAYDAIGFEASFLLWGRK